MARVWVGLTRYPFSASSGRWMWRCTLVNECSRWHYDVDDCGWAETHAEALRLGLAHAAMAHVLDGAS